MRYALLLVIAALLLINPTHVTADNPLSSLEATVQHRDQLQPGLDNYIVTVETAKIGEMISNMTASMPADMPRPGVPVITKYWQRRNGRSLIEASTEQTAPYVQQMIARFSKTLAVALDDLLMPAEFAERRQALAQKATVKSAETALAGKVLQQVELNFASPVDLDEAFYRTGIRLPQKQVMTLRFDIDAKSRTITQLDITSADGSILSAEFRYRQVPGGYLPERIHTTSPDGKVDDLFEVTFLDVSGFVLPQRMVRTLRRPDLSDDLDVTFKEYRLNQDFPEAVQTRLNRDD